MNKEIERYLAFAIENGYMLPKDMDAEYLSKCTFKIEVITSKPFIEAIARGYIKNNNPTQYWEVLSIWKYKNENWIKYIYDEIIEHITELQAIAIRDNTLSEYINNLLPNNKEWEK